MNWKLTYALAITALLGLHGPAAASGRGQLPDLRNQHETAASVTHLTGSSTSTSSPSGTADQLHSLSSHSGSSTLGNQSTHATPTLGNQSTHATPTLGDQSTHATSTLGDQSHTGSTPGHSLLDEAKASGQRGAATTTAAASVAPVSPAEAAEQKRQRSLGDDPATKQFRASERDTALRVERQATVRLERFQPKKGEKGDWVDEHGKVYDGCSPAPSRFFDRQWDNFRTSLKNHLDHPTVDHVVVDVTDLGLTREQLDKLQAHLDGLEQTQKSKIVKIGF